MIISSSHSKEDMEVFPVILRLKCKVQGSYKKVHKENMIQWQIW